MTILPWLNLNELGHAINEFVVTCLMLLYVALAIRRENIVMNEQKVSTAMSTFRWVKYCIVALVTKYFVILFFSALATFISIKTNLVETLVEMNNLAVLDKQEVSLAATIILILSSCVIAPLWEEILFRGVIFKRFMTKYSFFKASMLSSLLFSLIHVTSGNIVFAFVMGILLSIVYYRTKNITVCIILHGFINFSNFLIPSVSFINDTPQVYTAEFLYKSIYVNVLGSVLFGLIILVLIFKNRHFLRQLYFDKSN